MTESFLPQVNGVTNSVCRVLDHLAATGHQAIVFAPEPAPASYAGFTVHAVRSLALPFYRSVNVGLPFAARLTRMLRDFKPDVVHLASPVLLGAAGAVAARRLGVPSVGVFQTDLAGYARRYGLPGASPAVWSWLKRIHRQTTLTLVPSTATLRELAAHGIPRLALWRRGVDLDLFHPRHRAAGPPDGPITVGYVGRLATEKRPHLLAAVADLPGTRLSIIGTGPEGERLRRLLPNARFHGLRTGQELTRLLASFDVFVHTGSNETFCQAVQEALACGVPVVAPAAGGPLDLITPGVNGLLYPPDDPARLRAAVAELAADPALRRRMAEQARASVAGRTWTAVCDELVQHYTTAGATDPEMQPAAPKAGLGWKRP
ncbi:glycosyltransferase family 4 protein [Nonomuraea jiangxiensis]|uniref:Phosphatidylinositol alpha 1,6-mannosyltransferase n=1 Tax=Nonomuraea jiangxiensis TaxID=633440 RepID=A0A1G8I6E5_9ACTN|nr:glycosyltransferase family 1 protein [Nonomuraea jiangxiensis]SDI14392.1 phosphatidylinositol alpha 1,6-mannosyltransferase [Nonomuraea jiangxiensis]